MSDYGLIDGLAYTYSNGTNGLLMNVTDESSQQLGFRGPSSTYGYDGTGNLTSDSQKGITDILYSYNDLPLKIETDKGDIFNWYTSDGLKVKSKVVPSGPAVANPPVTTNYINSAEYKDNTLESIYVDEGRVVFQKTEGTYVEYFLKDHLGNTRVRIADKNGDHLVNVDSNNPEKDELMNIRHYYPFGMEWDTPLGDENGNSLDASGVKNKYSYNGKELISDLDINLHDYGARMYDPAIARFTTIDPLAESYSFQSGFAYAANNPISNIDFMGLSPEKINPTGEKAKKLYTEYYNNASSQRRTELDRLDESDVVYNISVTSLESTHNGKTTFSEVDGEVQLNVLISDKNSSPAQNHSLGDEMEHARQFEDGELALVKLTNGDVVGGNSYDAVDEMKSKDAGLEAAEAHLNNAGGQVAPNPFGNSSERWKWSKAVGTNNAKNIAKIYGMPAKRQSSRSAIGDKNLASNKQVSQVVFRHKGKTVNKK